MGIQTSTINSGPVSGFKNKIINGNFDFWQRGTSGNFTGSGTFFADRWRTSTNSNGATSMTGATYQQLLFDNGQTDVPGNPAFYVQFNGYFTTNVTSTTDVRLVQQIEDVRTFAGQQVTLSFWAKASANRTIGLGYAQDFGTGTNSPSTAVFAKIDNTAVSLTTSWQRFSRTFTLPSISGKTIGNGANSSSVIILFSVQAGSESTSSPEVTGSATNVQIAQVQLEQGPVATTFEQRPQQTELALCQRYFSKSYNHGVAPGTNTENGMLRFVAGGVAGTQNAGGTLTAPVAMRAEPTWTIFRQDGTGGSCNGSDGNNRNAAAAASSNQFAALSITNANNGILYRAHFTANAELT